MGLFSKTKTSLDSEMKEERITKEKISKMTSPELIMAMLLEMDASSKNILTDSPLGDEATKRCGHDPYE